MPSLKVETRIFGPCKSPNKATWRPSLAAISRTFCARFLWSSAVPCEKFIRTTLAPARIMASRISGLSVEGPKVATIFVLRKVELISLFLRCDSKVYPSYLTLLRCWLPLST
ncbi:Uncharacterised protein [Vibrio cholerae]|uniref:Uncharacterized protein n=1 Tax=Vibrio cholerae TaxID=666 RepID=A0A656AIF6_VIBCL|nr:Uncharacterised protein [Vibrio cholerae]